MAPLPDSTPTQDEIDHWVGVLTLRLGLLGEGALAQVRDELARRRSDDADLTLEQQLEEGGHLSASQLARLQQVLCQAQADTRGASPVGGGQRVGSQLGRYEDVSQINRGGMGIILAGTDPAANRQVAIKVLPRDETLPPELVAKFVAEGQITAQLEHPNIVPVHEVAKTPDGELYFAMKLVKGQSLADLVNRRNAEPPPIGRLLGIFDRICDAIAFAHSRGVIHRDLKPANVMLGEFGEVLVMDWGLARLEGARGAPTPVGVDSGALMGSDASPPEATRAGAVLGTPHYMPPEQARGDQAGIDERADIYALGAILYEILTGEPPFTGGTAWEVLVKVIESRPLAPSERAPDRAIPRELDAAVSKAMAPDAADRYPSVQALQSDIQRYRDGQLISAATYTPLQRLAKWAARHRAVVGAGGVVALVLLVAGTGAGLSELQRRRAEDAAVVSERARRQAEQDALATLRKRTGTALRTALVLRRNGLVREMEALLPDVEGACAEVIEAWPKLAEPHYQLGLVYAAMLRDDAAVAALDRALALEPAHTPARVRRLGLLIGRYWVREEQLVAESADLGRAPSTAPGDAVLTALRLRAQADVEVLREAPDLAVGERDSLLGTASWLSGQRKEAAEAYRRALAAAPELLEARLGVALEAWGRGDHAAAIRAYSAGLARHKGYVPFFEGRAIARRDLARRSVNLSQSALRFRAALDDHAEAVRMAPDAVGARVSQAQTQLAWGRDRWTRFGEDPTAQLEAARAALTALLAASPGARRARIVLCNVWQEIGRARHQRKADATAAFEAAVALFDRREALGPREHGWRVALASARRDLGRYQAAVGKDGRPEVRRAVAIAREAVGLRPDSPLIRFHVAAARFDLARLENQQKIDPRPLLGRARQDVLAGLNGRPRSEGLWRLLLDVEVATALAQVERGTPPDRAFTRALEVASRRVQLFPLRTSVRDDLQRVSQLLVQSLARGEAIGATDDQARTASERIAANPGDARLWLFRSLVYWGMANRRVGIGQDPGEEFARAVADAEKGLALAPRDEDGWKQLGDILMSRARHDIERRRRTPRETFGPVLAFVERCNAQHPRSVPLLRKSAYCLQQYALMQGDAGQDPLPTFAAALERAAAALAVSEEEPYTWTRRGWIHEYRGDYLRSVRRDPTSDYQAAIRDYKEANRRGGHAARLWERRGSVHAGWAVYLRKSGRDPSPSYAVATQDYVNLVEREPDVVSHRLFLAALYNNYANAIAEPGRRVALWNSAIGVLTAAIATAPDKAEAWRQRASYRFNLGNQLKGMRRDPAPTWRAAIEDAGRAIAAKASDPAAWRVRGGARVNLANHARNAGRLDGLGDLYARALEDLGRATRLSGADAHSWQYLGNAHLGHATYLRQLDRDPRAAYGAALKAFERAVACDARQGPRLASRIQLCRRYLKGAQ